MWRDGADSRYIGGTTAGVAELADAQDLGTESRLEWLHVAAASY
jgi:hypothetical protein